MVIPFGRTLFGLIAALALSSVASAQDEEFQEAVKLLRMGQKEEALAKLQEVLQSDLSNEDALRLYRNTDQDIWYMLVLEEGEIGMIAQSLLDRAKMERRELSRDSDAIAQLVEDACSAASGFEERSAAIRALVSYHGEYAVPALVRRMAIAEDEVGQINAIVALYNLGPAATLPLLEVLESANVGLRQNAAAALSQVGDPRAAAGLARLAQVDDRDGVREIARRTLGRLGVASGVSPVDLFLANARAYLRGTGVGMGQMSDVVWSLEDGQLVYVEVPAELYSLELGKKNAHAALSLDPGSDEARKLLAQTYLAQAAAVSESLAANPDNPSLAQKLDSLRMVALATGADALRMALQDALATDLAAVAAGALGALAIVEDESSASDAPLVEALHSSDIRLSYAAALALAAMGSEIPAEQAQAVVEALGRAVSEESMRIIKVIDSAPATARVVAEASGRGTSYQVVDSAVKAIGELYTFPNVDVVVINEILDRVPEDVISLIRKDPRMEHVKILILANDVDAAGDRFGATVDGVIQGPLDAQSLQAEVNSALEGVEMGLLRRRANDVAADASNALMLLAGANVNVVPALASLTGQLDRDDEVAIPAAKAIGDGGNPSQLGVLLAAIQSETSSADLKVACAGAAGGILGRANETPEEIFEGLIAVLAYDADSQLKMSLAIALGKATLSPGQRLRLVNLLRTVGSVDGDG